MVFPQANGFPNTNPPVKRYLSDEETIRSLFPQQPAQCLEILYSRYASKVYQHCLKMTNHSQQAEDFTHDIFLRVFTVLGSFEHRAKFSTWLYSISFNYCLDQLRLSKRLTVVPIDLNHSWQSDDSWELSYKEVAQQVKKAMGHLSAMDRTFLELKYEEGLSLEQIAQQYNLTPGAVKMRLSRSRQRVKSIYMLL
ncbi:RNA polymerase sigma factor [Spirosoma telluris]|uniref:RNA polymerase sigma factor n=1 Tax=Spirosoma telluris TaxID=2183553 RepID=UPI0012FA6485